ncbi:hypothetical protein F4212_01300 [Candidatus Poribacteria bacterium]|nr:hypothetical protein [Candidatus Poribacteria bacterium]
MITPVFAIISDGNNIADKIDDKFISLSVTDKVSTSGDTADFSLYWDGSFAIPKPGVVFEVQIGYAEEGLWQVGKFVAQENTLSGPEKVLSVRGISQPQSQDAAVGALQGTTEREWQAGTTFSEIVEDVCSTAGLTAKVASELVNIAMPHTSQVGESDAQILSRIARNRDAFVKYHDNQVIIEKKDSRRIGKLEIAENQVTSYNFITVERSRFASVTAKYQDAAAGQVEKVTAGEGDPQKVINNTFPDRQSALDAAETILKNMTRQSLTAEITLPTIAGLLAEKVINLKGFPDESFNTEYVLEQVTHKLDKQGGLRSVCKLQQFG